MKRIKLQFALAALACGAGLGFGQPSHAYDYAALAKACTTACYAQYQECRRLDPESSSTLCSLRLQLCKSRCFGG